MTPAGSARPTAFALRLVAAAVIVALAAIMTWSLRGLIMPVFAGGVLAYICRPFLVRLERWRIPRGAAIGLLLLLIGGATLSAFNGVRAAIPNEAAILELRVHAVSALNQRYRALMGLDASWGRGNDLYRWTRRDLDPLMDRVSDALSLTPDERAPFVTLAEGPTDEAASRANRLLDGDRANARAREMRARRRGLAGPATESVDETVTGRPAAFTGRNEPPTIGGALSPWLVAPLIFLFLLWDPGTLRRGLLRAIPNRLFEPALAVMEDVDEAVGNYVRGIFLECAGLGLTVVVFFAIVGVPLRWAVVIGLFTGATNVVPYMGFAAALMGGLTYALLAEDFHPVIPIVTAETFALWVVGAVALAEILKNVIYEPIILGRTVRLHPIAVVTGVAGGAILFGPAGMLLAIPTITIVRVLIASSARHLKAYGLV